jgi:general secretion pathway protein J
MKHGTAGFTLIELLVAMTLLSIVVLGLMGGVRFVGGVSDRDQRALAAIIDRDEMRMLFSRQVTQAFPVRIDRKGVSALIFTGSPDRLAFPILRPPGQGPGGLILAAFTIETHDQRWQLVYHEFPFMPGSTVNVSNIPTRTKIIGDVPPSMTFEYRGRDTDWTPEWKIVDRLPQMVRMSDGDQFVLTAWPRARNDLMRVIADPNAPPPGRQNAH